MNIWINEIKKRTLSGEPPILSGRSNKIDKINFDDLIFIPAQLTATPIDYFKEKIETKTILGKLSKNPVVLNTPIMNAAISFGAISKEAKIILAKASANVGSIANTGEGGMLPEERKNAELLIVQYSTGRFGITEEVLKQADMIEIKIGQGAKPGQGGLLKKEKITDEIAAIRQVSKDQDVHSPCSHLDIKNIKDLKKKVQWLKKITNNRPIIIKLGAGNVEEDVKLAIKANPDIIAIDGLSGGTGAAPEIMLNDFGLPIIPAIVKARKILDKLKAKQELIVGGGLNKGADIAKALALGADAVFLGFPLLIAMGCIYCQQCFRGLCPKGIATQNPELRKKLNMEEATISVSNYIKSCTEEVKMVAGAIGKKNIHQLNSNDLRALTFDMAKIAEVKLV
jgi:glutamate synthase domain-containing protein 2